MMAAMPQFLDEAAEVRHAGDAQRTERHRKRDPQSPRMLVEAAQMKGERQAIELEASDLDVRRGRHLVAIGEEEGIQALILRRGRPCCEKQENQRASGAPPPASGAVHPTEVGARTHPRKDNLARSPPQLQPVV